MATLNVTISEDLVLNGQTIVSKNSASYTVTSIDHRIIKCTTTEQTVLLFNSADAAGTVKDATLKYLRFTNLDSTNFVIVRVKGNNEEYFVKVPAGASFVLSDGQMDANATGGETVSLANIDEISIDADTATCDVEMYAASDPS
jgi:hypothetical protein|tara:strand:+ start:1719 stop:2150 length:432 start_codon:yes stop_codon:yes gene_type:complete